MRFEMSRLHELKLNPPATIPGNVSGRAGTRHTRTRAKTARSLGQNYTPTQGWRERSQGLDSAKIRMAKEMKGMKKQAKETVQDDSRKL